MRSETTTGVRRLRHGAALAILVLALPGVAHAGHGWSFLEILLFGSGRHTGERPFALEIQATSDLNTQPLPLSVPGWLLRPGVQGRLVLGVPQTGMELIVGAGHLAAAPGRRGTLRTELGATMSMRLGGSAVLYGLGTAGLWLNRDMLPDSWGPAMTVEWRGAVGLRLPVGPYSAVVVEVGLSNLGMGPIDGGPLLGARIGWSVGPNDYPERRRRGLLGALLD